MHRLRSLCGSLRFRRDRSRRGEGKGFRAKNISASCKGCGLCASSCPQQAIDMLHFKDQQIIAAVCAAAYLSSKMYLVIWSELID